jgi:hypothetical protein
MINADEKLMHLTEGAVYWQRKARKRKKTLSSNFKIIFIVLVL